ncbi:RCC1 domain-containing protein [Nannocystis exedens]|nr:hypothetical protein [Nannocystis exedens]
MPTGTATGDLGTTVPTGTETGDLGTTPGTSTGVEPTTGEPTTGGNAGPKALQVAVTWLSTCVLDDGGALRCWGLNDSGGLGQGHTLDTTAMPASVNAPVELGAPVVALAGGQGHTCALVSGGKVRCWGWNVDGQLGYGHTQNVGDDEKPAAAGDIDLGAEAVDLAVGSRHNCALTVGGKVRCWGKDDKGVLGYGDGQSIGDDETPATAGDLPIAGEVVQISAGMFHNCVLMKDRTVRCWGHNDGRLGYGHNATILEAGSAGPLDLGAEAASIASGSHHNCAITTSGGLRCWGMNFDGQLGYGHQETIGDDEAPSAAGEVPLGGAKVIDVALGLSYTCVLLDSGEVRCAGRNDDGQLGLGHTFEVSSLSDPVELGVPIVDLNAHGYHTCGLAIDGTVRCWGRGAEGALGYGMLENVGDDEVPATAGPVPFL